jgi:hypothetical protein
MAHRNGLKNHSMIPTRTSVPVSHSSFSASHCFTVSSMANDIQERDIVLQSDYAFGVRRTGFTEKKIFESA